MDQAWMKDVLVCPDCNSSLEFLDPAVRCSACGFDDQTGRDLLPQRHRELALTLDRNQSSDPEEALEQLVTARPTVTYFGPLALRDSRELMSAISQYLVADARVLDLGCGPRDQQAPIESLGYKYVGIDFTSSAAHFLADAHAPPFRP